MFGDLATSVENQGELYTTQLYLEICVLKGCLFDAPSEELLTETGYKLCL